MKTLEELGLVYYDKKYCEGILNIGYVKEFMEYYQLSTKTFAEMSEMSEQTLKKILSGKTNFDYSQVFRLARAMELKYSDIFLPMNRKANRRKRRILPRIKSRHD